MPIRPQDRACVMQGVHLRDAESGTLLALAFAGITDSFGGGQTHMIGLLRGFAIAWTGVLLTVVAISFMGFMRTSDSASEAFQRMITTYDPFSTANTVLILVLVLPAFGANALADRLYKGPRR